jgi:hypothetical protein
VGVHTVEVFCFKIRKSFSEKRRQKESDFMRQIEICSLRSFNHTNHILSKTLPIGNSEHRGDTRHKFEIAQQMLLAEFRHF